MLGVHAGTSYSLQIILIPDASVVFELLLSSCLLFCLKRISVLGKVTLLAVTR